MEKVLLYSKIGRGRSRPSEPPTKTKIRGPLRQVL